MSSQPFRRILVATDFSLHAAAALEQAIDLAKRLGASLVLVHAYDLPLPALHPYAVTVPDPYIQACRDEARRRLDALLEDVRGRGVEAEARLEVVPAAVAVCEAAKEEGCDLIVMGTHGHRGIARALLGSVAERTLRMAPCSVLTVRGPAD
jgi:nucleotide-binding universal stress UspA family protein